MASGNPDLLPGKANDKSTILTTESTDERNPLIQKHKVKKLKALIKTRMVLGFMRYLVPIFKQF